MPGSSTTPGRTGTRAFAPAHVAFQLRNGVGARERVFRGSMRWPVHSPADASPVPSGAPAHGSGPMRFATPSSWRTFTAYSLPVSPAHSVTPDDDAICWWDRAEMEAWAQRSRSHEIEPDALNRIEFGPIGWAMLPICICHPTNSVVPQVFVDQWLRLTRWARASCVVRGALLRWGLNLMEVQEQRQRSEVNAVLGGPGVRHG
jgi:hypothetical protein